MFYPERRNPALRFAIPATNAAQCQSDQFAFGWIRVSTFDVCRSNAGKTARERCHA